MDKCSNSRQFEPKTLQNPEEVRDGSQIENSEENGTQILPGWNLSEMGGTYKKEE